MMLHPGQSLNNRYRIVKLLGQGGFGAVYKVWDLNLERPRALKENLDTSPEAQRQFKREAQILDVLDHPSLPRVLDHFVVPNQGQYLVMEYIEGEDLQEILDRNNGPLQESKVLSWIKQICDALTHLHNQNPPIIHRDIKPANIKITPGGKASLVDFGIAKVYDPKLKTTIGARAVTPGYSPHEQYGQGRTDARTDVYALGATLYTLLTGRESIESVLRMIGDSLEPPERVNSSISPGVAAAIWQAMKMDPAHRYQDAASFKTALVSPTRILTSLQSPESGVTQSYQPQTAAMGGTAQIGTKSKWLFGAAGLVIVVLVIAVISLLGNTGSFGDSQVPVVGAQSTMAPVDPVMSTITPIQESIDPPSKGEGEEPLEIITDTHTPTITETPSLTLTPTPSTGVGSTLVSPKDGMVMVYVPEGEFMMGGRSDDRLTEDDEFPQHAVFIDAIWIDQTEVTNEKFSTFISATGYQTDAERLGWAWNWNPGGSEKLEGATWKHPFGPSSSVSGMSNHPVVNVSWKDAYAYCQWAGRKLPSEAEWEKAARWNPATGAVHIYPWGDSPPNASLVNYENLHGNTTAVGDFPEGSSPVGALDMAGNVGEWVHDFYNNIYYRSASYFNPLGPTEGELYKGLRGGGYKKGLDDIRTSYRSWGIISNGYSVDGFRCVLSARD